MKRREFLKSAGVGARRLGRRCRARHRAIDAGDEMAADGELGRNRSIRSTARLRVFRQARRRSDRQQIPDPGFRRRRNRARPAGARRGAERHGRDRPHRVAIITSARTRPSPSARRCRSGSIRASRMPGCRFGGGNEADERVLQEVQHASASRPAIPARRWAAGSARRSRRSTISTA